MAPSGSHERITVVRCRSWPIVGCGRRSDELAAVFVANRVVAASALAIQAGVVPGLRRREAQRRAPALEVLAPDISAEARAFEPILRSIDDITPRVEIDRPGTCSFLTRGPSRYFGGDEAMSERVAQVVTAELAGRTTVHVGTADSRFAAARAAELAPAGQARVIPPGASAAFLAPLPIRLLTTDVEPGPLRRSLDDLIDVLSRLGLPTLGAFAALQPGEVTERFGAVGVRAYLWASGVDDRPPSPTDPPAELEVSVELDPPVERVDHAAFVAKALADDFMRKLGERGAGCARIAVIAETEHGEEHVRLWRSDEAFGAAAIADRMRWQLDGWLSGPARQRPTGGLARLALRPDDVAAIVGRQLGFWGEQTGIAERAARAVARVQGLIGPGRALVPEVQGGRSPDQTVVAIPAESVDLVERASAVDRTLIGDVNAQATAGATGEHAGLPWPGQLPRPAPSMVFDPPVAVELVDAREQMVTVSSRGIMGQHPAWLRLPRQGAIAVTGWSGPWLLDERWWHGERHRRQARMQIALADGRAVVVATRRGQWFLDAAYD